MGLMVFDIAYMTEVRLPFENPEKRKMVNLSFAQLDP